MKPVLLRIVKRSGMVISVLLFIILFVYLQGVQYTLATLTNLWTTTRPTLSVADSAHPPTPASSRPSGPIRVLTYNVLCRVCAKDGYDPWDARLPHLREIISIYAPDLLGLQELGGKQDIAELNPDPDRYTAQAHTFGPWTYGDAALLYRSDRFDLVESGQFWLAPNPDLPLGFAWVTLSPPRYINWAHLRQKSNGFEFLFLNTHFDNDPPNKEASAPLVHDSFSPFALALPVIFTGDFNTQYDTQRYHNLQRGTSGGELLFFNSADMAPRLEEIPKTSGMNPSPPSVSLTNIAHMIDHIFLAGPVHKKVNRWVVDRRVYAPGDRSPSDHPALFAEVEFGL